MIKVNKFYKIFIFVLTNLMHKICFTISLFHASTCFEHHVLIVRRSKLYYTASGIITPIGVMILIVKQILCIRLVNTKINIL